MASITVRHNIEVAHRLFNLKGKCEAIHGHSMMVHMTLEGVVNAAGLLDNLEFGAVKSMFRQYLDTNYDHRLLLNENDPWAGKLFAPALKTWTDGDIETTTYSAKDMGNLPGLVAVHGDPTTENIARWIANWGANAFHLPCEVTVEETQVNAASFAARPRNGS